MHNKNKVFDTFLHYSSNLKKKTVFGEPTPKLFYNYTDRLSSPKWNEALKSATPQTARFYELALNHYFDKKDVNVQHIQIEVGGNGYSYMAIGYTCSPNSEQV